MTPTNILDVMDVYDNLFIEEQFGFDLPEWTQSIYPQPLKSLSAYAFLAFSYSDKLKRLSKCYLY